MKAGRESVWLVVPFTVGIAVVNYSLPLFYEHSSAAVAILLAAVAGLVLCVLGTRQRRAAQIVTEREKDDDILESLCGAEVRGREPTSWQRRAALGLMFFFAGVTICILANLADLIEVMGAGAGAGMDGGAAVRPSDWPAGDEAVRASRIRLFINDCGERFRTLIDDMPFGDGLSNALVKALLAGDRSSLPWDVRNSFRAAGASHLLALSGLHLSVIYLVVSKLLSVTGNSPAAVKVRSALIILFSAFFTIVTGASPSLMRAFLFILLRECATLSRRQTDNINIFCMSLMLQLVLNPNDISSVGFQLSYLAILGIFLLEPPLERFWDVAGGWLKSLRREKKALTDMADTLDVPEEDVPKNGTIKVGDKTPEMGTTFGKAMRKIWSLCAISISCQVFTAPAVLLYFGTFPSYFLLTNLLCLPLSNVLITASVVAVLLSMLGLCPSFLLSLIDFLVRTLLYILDIISSM